MTRAQEVIRKYIYTDFPKDGVLLFPTGKDKIKIIDEKGKSMTLTINLFGDILNADTGEMCAISDLPHDLCQIGLQLPQSWKEVEQV